MDKVSSRLTVFFENPYWVGIFERISEGQLSACKVVFGAEPRDYEVYRFVLEKYDQLRFSPAINVVVKEAKRNPKRMQREAKKQVSNAGIGTKSQQALKLQQEQRHAQQKNTNRQVHQADQELRFRLKQQKRKQKHKGR